MALQMQDAVDDLERKFTAGRGAELAGLGNGARDRNNQLPVTGAIVKTQDIGRPVRGVILLIEACHGCVADQHDAEIL